VSPDLLRRQVTLVGPGRSKQGRRCAEFVADRNVDVEKLFTHAGGSSRLRKLQTLRTQTTARPYPAVLSKVGSAAMMADVFAFVPRRSWSSARQCDLDLSERRVSTATSSIQPEGRSSICGHELYGGKANVLAAELSAGRQSVHGRGWVPLASATVLPPARSGSAPRLRGMNPAAVGPSGLRPPCRWSPSESIKRLAQLKKAAAWMTSAIARSSSPERRSGRRARPNALGVAVSATEAATMAFQRSPRSAETRRRAGAERRPRASSRSRRARMHRAQ